MKGLNAEAAGAVKECDREYAQYYISGFHAGTVAEEIIGELDKRVLDVQQTLTDLSKHAMYVQSSFCDTVARSVSSEHRALDALQQRAFGMTQHDEVDPALRFLRTVRAYVEIDHVFDEVWRASRRTEELLGHVVEVGRYLHERGERFPAPSAQMFSIVVCPKDGTKLRLPENSGNLIATCPVCKYRFAYNTNPVSYPVSEVPPKLSWWLRTWHLLRRQASCLLRRGRVAGLKKRPSGGWRCGR